MPEVFSKNDIHSVAENVLSKLVEEHDRLATKESATIVALSGDLGAGKTTLTQQIAAKLGIRENVISPTFVIMKSYTAKHSAFKTLVHIDAYRLNSHAELEKLGWRELVSNPANLIVLEWPERIAPLLPEDVFAVLLEHASEETREISFSRGLKK